MIRQWGKFYSGREATLAGVGLTLLIILVALGFIAGRGQSARPVSEDLLDYVLDRGVIRVATDANAAPQSLLQPDGTFEGFDIDVATEIAKRLGVKVRFVVPGGWEAVIGGHWADQWDMSVGSMTVTRQRAEVLYFTPGYYYSSTQFAARRGADVTTIDDIHGKPVCVGLATTYHRYLTGKDVGIPEADIKVEAPVGVKVLPLSDAECLQAIQVGRQEFDIFLTSNTVIDQAVADGIDLVKVGEPVFVETLAVAFDRNSSRDSSRLHDKVSRLIEEMHADGTLTGFSKKWFNGADLTVASGSK